MNIRIQQVFPDDWELFRQVRLAALADAPWAFGARLETWAEAGEEQWRSRLSDVPGNWVALSDGAPSGLIGAMLTEPGCALLISMWVAPSARGQGVGDELVRALLTWARSQPGLARVELDVYQNNVSAQKLYLRNGFAFVSADDQEERRMRLTI